MTVVVYCHGDADRMTITDMDAIRLGPDGLRQINTGTGVAFAVKRLHFAGFDIRRREAIPR